MRRLNAVAVSVPLLAVASCGSQQSAKPSPTPPQTAKIAVHACPKSDGGACLGRLRAGTYRTKAFSPAISYTIPGGWQNFEDTPGNFLLVPPGQSLRGVNAGTSDYIGIYTAVAPTARDCRDARADVYPKPAPMARWFVHLPGVKPTTARRVGVGGLHGFVIDLAMRHNWKKTCPFSNHMPFINLIRGLPPSDLDHGLIPGLAIRLYLLNFHGGALAIEVDDLSGGRHLARYDSVITHLHFAG